MSFFEYQYGERREPKGAYELCCQAIQEYYDTHGYKFTAHDPVDDWITDALKTIYETKEMREQLLLIHHRLAYNRLISRSYIADARSGHAFFDRIFESLKEDFVVLEYALARNSGLLHRFFTWLLNSRINLGHLLKYVKILYIIVDMKFNMTNRRSFEELQANLKRTMEWEVIGLIETHNFFRKVSQILREENSS